MWDTSAVLRMFNGNREGFVARKYRTKLPDVGRNRPYHDGLYRNLVSYGVLAESVESFSLCHPPMLKTRGKTRVYYPDLVEKAITDPLAVERMEGNIMWGYYGHDRREDEKQRRGTTYLPAFNARIEDKGLTITPNIPACRTVAIEINKRVVMHRQQILDTPPGRAIIAMMQSGAGGWSWSMRGIPVTDPDGYEICSVTAFEGFDYVAIPGLLPIHRARHFPCCTYLAYSDEYYARKSKPLNLA